MEEPLVSVILPTYNRASYLPRAVESVLSQDYRNLELIIIDDGSNDNTREVVEKLGDERIIYMRTPVNRGVSAARNAGIRRAKGKYIAFQDSDDMWLPRKLAKQVEVLEHSAEDVAMVYHIMSKTSQNQKKYIPGDEISRQARRGRLFGKLLGVNYIDMPTVCIRSSVLKSSEGVGGFDTQIPNLEDWELLLRIAKDYEIEYIDEVLLDAFVLPDGVNGNMFNGIISNCMIIQKYKWEMKNLGIYESKLNKLRDFGSTVNASEWVEKIIQKYCEGKGE